MAEQLSESAVVDLAGKLFERQRAERRELDKIDRWYRWQHDAPHASGTGTTREYRQLAERAEAPWGGLIVTSVAQALYVDGYRRPDAENDSDAWGYWRANDMKRRQNPLHRDALAYGLSYASVLPGADPLTKKKIPVIRGISPRNMLAVYDNPADDEWPEYAIRVDKMGSAGFRLRLYLDKTVHMLVASNDSGTVKPTYKSSQDHNAGVVPIVRYANQLDNEGRAPGEVEPFIPLLKRIDQTVFDRLVVQRFGAWVVRTITGMSKPENMADSDWLAFQKQAKLALSVDGILVAEDADAKLGSLPATPLDGFIEAGKTDLHQLAAVSQTPAHEMLGEMANLSAEALAAARASLSAKVEERRYSLGPSHEQTFRLAGHIMGNSDVASDMDAEVRWRDTEIRSLAQAADALGKLATMLGVPVEVLWEKIPGWTDTDVERARAKAQAGGVDALLAQLTGAQVPPQPNPAPQPPLPFPAPAPAA